MKERQWAENVEREGLSPIAEAIALQDAADLERKIQPDVAIGDLVEKVGAERGLHGSVARNLVGLLRSPRSLQSAMMSRSIGREVGLELARFERGIARREIRYRGLVAAWARTHGLGLSAQAMTRYAAETFQDPKVVKATCRKAEDSERALLALFDAVVARATNERWTVAKTKTELAALRRASPQMRADAGDATRRHVTADGAARPKDCPDRCCGTRGRRGGAPHHSMLAAMLMSRASTVVLKR